MLDEFCAISSGSSQAARLFVSCLEDAIKDGGATDQAKAIERLGVR